MVRPLIFLYIVVFQLFSLFLNQVQAQDIIDNQTVYERAKKEYKQFEEKHGHYFQTHNVRMHYSTWGNPKGIPFLWIHGTNSSSTEILDFVSTLTENNYYVIAIDYYGHGLTPIPQKDVSIYHVADDVKELLDHLKIEKVILGGWSRGGIIAAAFYDTYPSKVKALILEDGGSASFLQARQLLDEDILKNKYEKMYSSSEDISFESEFEAFKYYYNPAWDDSQFWLLSLIRKGKNGKWLINPDIKEWLGQMNAQEGIRNIYRTSTAPLFEASSLLLNPVIVFRNLSIPLLIFNPQGDDTDGFFAFSDQNEHLRKLHPNFITVKNYADCGHAVHFEKPKEFIIDLMGFLKLVR